jgi:membrane protein
MMLLTASRTEGSAGLVGAAVMTRAAIAGKSASFILNIVRWPVMLVLVALARACIYRYGPSRDKPKWRWITWGSAFATLAWLGFSNAPNRSPENSSP